MLSSTLMSNMRRLLPKPGPIGMASVPALAPQALRLQGERLEQQASSAVESGWEDLVKAQSEAPTIPNMIPDRQTGIVLAVAELAHRLLGGQSSLLPSYAAGRQVAVEETVAQQNREIQAKLNQAAMTMQKARLNQSAAQRKASQLYQQASEMEARAWRREDQRLAQQSREQSRVEQEGAMRIDSRRKFILKALESSPEGKQLYIQHADSIDRGEIPPEVQTYLAQPIATTQQGKEVRSENYVVGLSIPYVAGLVNQLPKSRQGQARLGYRSLMDGAMQGLDGSQLLGPAYELVGTLDAGLDELRAQYRKDRENVDLLFTIRELESELFRLQSWVAKEQRGFRPVNPQPPSGLSGPIIQPKGG